MGINGGWGVRPPSLCIQPPYFVTYVDLGGSGPPSSFSLIPTLAIAEPLVTFVYVRLYRVVCYLLTLLQSDAAVAEDGDDADDDVDVERISECLSCSIACVQL